MNQFICDYIAQLATINTDADVECIYHWLWNRQQDIAQTATAINNLLGLTGRFVLQPDLPCLTIGSRAGLLFLFVNPGWTATLQPNGLSLNQMEDAYCHNSPQHYVDLMLNYFGRSYHVLRRRITYAAQMISFVPLLQNGAARFGNPRGPAARWQAAHATKLVGHWELFPFHSEADGITRHTGNHQWLDACVHESVSAALRLRPEVLCAFSKQGCRLLRRGILANQHWTDTPIGTSNVRANYSVVPGAQTTTEVVAVPRQVLSCHRIFTNQDLFEAVNALRTHYPNNPP